MVILLHRLGLWNAVVEACEIVVAKTIVSVEASFYEDDAGDKHPIDLAPDEANGRIRVVSVSAKDLKAYRNKFGPLYVDALDAGEAESLAYLDASPDPHLICSADKIVYRVLGNVYKPDQGVSLEEVLAKIGHATRLPHAFGREYREYWTQQGFREKLMGLGSKDTSVGG